MSSLFNYFIDMSQMSPFFVEKTCFWLINVWLMSIKWLNKERQPLPRKMAPNLLLYWIFLMKSLKLYQSTRWKNLVESAHHSTNGPLLTDTYEFGNVISFSHNFAATFYQFHKSYSITTKIVISPQRYFFLIGDFLYVIWYKSHCRHKFYIGMCQAYVKKTKTNRSPQDKH